MERDRAVGHKRLCTFRAAYGVRRRAGIPSGADETMGHGSAGGSADPRITANRRMPGLTRFRAEGVAARGAAVEVVVARFAGAFVEGDRASGAGTQMRSDAVVPIHLDWRIGLTGGHRRKLPRTHVRARPIRFCGRVRLCGSEGPCNSARSRAIVASRLRHRWSIQPSPRGSRLCRAGAVEAFLHDDPRHARATGNV